MAHAITTRLGGLFLIYRKEELERNLSSWMAAALDGDSAAYEKLLTRAGNLVRGFLLNSAGGQISPEETEDLVQDVLLSIHLKKHLFDRKRQILPWLFAIARYKLIDVLRRRRRRPVEVALDPQAEWLEGREPAAAEPEDISGTDEILQHLSGRQREVVSLAKLEGLPLSEVARMTGMSLSAVKVTIHRAVKLLRKKYNASFRM